MEENKLKLSKQEKIKCLAEIKKKIKKIIFVYEKTQEPESGYDYKDFCEGILTYVASSNILFEGDLINIVINLNAIITNDFEKKQLKRIAGEMLNNATYLLNCLTKKD